MTGTVTHSDQTARFCEHDGIFIRFSRAGSNWYALATGALKPWWLKLRLPGRAANMQANRTVHNKKNAKI